MPKAFISLNSKPQKINTFCQLHIFPNLLSLKGQQDIFQTSPHNTLVCRSSAKKGIVLEHLKGNFGIITSFWLQQCVDYGWIQWCLVVVSEYPTARVMWRIFLMIVTTLMFGEGCDFWIFAFLSPFRFVFWVENVIKWIGYALAFGYMVVVLLCCR